MDCNRALEIDPKMEKVLYRCVCCIFSHINAKFNKQINLIQFKLRRAQALEKIGLKASAHKDLKRCLEIAPSSAVKAMIEKLADKVRFVTFESYVKRLFHVFFF